MDHKKLRLLLQWGLVEATEAGPVLYSWPSGIMSSPCTDSTNHRSGKFQKTNLSPTGNSLRSIYIVSVTSHIVCLRAKSHQSCPTLCDPMDCSPPGSSVHGIFQGRILGCHAFLQGIALTQREKLCLSLASPALVGRFFTTSVTSGAPFM